MSKLTPYENILYEKEEKKRANWKTVSHKLQIVFWSGNDQKSKENEFQIFVFSFNFWGFEWRSIKLFMYAAFDS